MKMNFFKKVFLTFCFGMLASQVVWADSVTDSIKKKFGEIFLVEIKGVEKTPFEGLYEVQLPYDIIYTNANVDYIMVGKLVDAKTKTDLTGPRLEKLFSVKIDSLPLDKAIKRTIGNGERRIVTFEDPNCGYCKKLVKELAQLDNVTIYTFMVPILSADSAVKAQNIWCASDRTAAWLKWMEHNTEPAKATCKTPLSDNLKLAEKLYIRGTPVVFFENDRRINGFVELKDIRRIMEDKPL